MRSLLVDNIGLLVTNDPELGDTKLGLRRNTAIVTVGERIAWVGDKTAAPPADDRLDAHDNCVIPGFVDSHTHVIFSGDRAEEFAARMAGKTYTAGGIRTTVSATRAASDTQLLDNARGLAAEAAATGTTTMEIKSGYGLTVPDEQRSLQIAQQLTPHTTFLGAHVVPPEYANRTDDYVAFVVEHMLPACKPYAAWADVFCEEGAFDADATRHILTAAATHGLGLRIHANQLSPGPGVQLAVELQAASADHCTYLEPSDVDALAHSTTVATLLPGAEFSTRSPYPDARRLLDAGAAVALATDCNPGTSYTTNMAFCMALAVRDLSMTCEEALWAATAGGARALRKPDLGVISPQAYADLAILTAPSYVHLAYRPGVNLIGQVVRKGSVVPRRGAG